MQLNVFGDTVIFGMFAIPTVIPLCSKERTDAHVLVRPIPIRTTLRRFTLEHHSRRPRSPRRRLGYMASVLSTIASRLILRLETQGDASAPRISVKRSLKHFFLA